MRAMKAGARRMRAAVRALELGATIVAVAGCGGSGITNPMFQPEISNVADNFQLQATGVTNVTQTVSYTWQNSGTLASVDQSGAITGGTATLTILDAQGSQVYSADLGTTGSFTTGAGQTGGWTIRLSLTGVSGTLNFRVQKG